MEGTHLATPLHPFVRVNRRVASVRGRVARSCSWGVFVPSRVVSVRPRSVALCAFMFAAVSRGRSGVCSRRRGVFVVARSWKTVVNKQKNERNRKKKEKKETERGRTSPAPCARSHWLVSVRALAWSRRARSRSRVVASHLLALVRGVLVVVGSWKIVNKNKKEQKKRNKEAKKKKKTERGRTSPPPVPVRAVRSPPCRASGSRCGRVALLRRARRWGCVQARKGGGGCVRARDGGGGRFLVRSGSGGRVLELSW